ncbi:hypothetical protein LPJ81_003045, partial [Coemansia sp. IMI 209127]
HSHGCQGGRNRSTWVNPFTEVLHRSVEPNCRVCDCAMNSWDMYFDHLMFDENHQLNEMREMFERNSRTKSTSSSHSPLPRSRHDNHLHRRQPTSPSPSPISAPSISSSFTSSPFHRY